MNISLKYNPEDKSFFGQLKASFVPFGKSDKMFFIGLCTLQFGAILYMWYTLGNVYVPKPIPVIKQLFTYITSVDFWNCFVTTFLLTIKAMVYSIIFSCIFAFIWTLSSFKSTVGIVTKFRFLSMSGLVFTAIMVLKDGAQVKLFLLMLGVIPYFLASLISSITKIDKQEFKLCETLGMSKWQTFYELVAYGRMEVVLDTIRMNFAMVWLMITNIEIISMTGTGIGIRLHDLDRQNYVTQIFAIQIFIGLFGTLFDFSTFKLRHKIFKHTKLTEQN